MQDRLNQGVLLIDAGAQIMFANRAAEAVLAERDGLRTNKRTLTASNPAVAAALKRAAAEAAETGSGETLPVPRAGRRPLTVLIVPLQA